MSTHNIGNLEVVTERFDQQDMLHLDYAEDFESWRAEYSQTLLEEDQMLPLDEEHLAKHLFGVVAFIMNSEVKLVPVGYNAATFIFEDGSLEIGGLIVNPRYRGLGIATIVKKEIMSQAQECFPGRKLITFANRNSEKLNRKFGFVDATEEEVPRSALHVCKEECTKYTDLQESNRMRAPEDQVLCCDTILIHDPSYDHSVGEQFVSIRDTQC